MNAQTQAAKLVSLREQATNLAKLRTEAESSVKFAQNQYDAVVQKIKDMGIDPANAETELAAMDSELQILSDQLTAAMETERKEYNQILATTRTLLGAQK